jgi:ribosome biogenesis GTPase
VALGYSPRWQALYAASAGADQTPARVIRADRGSCLVAWPDGVTRAKPAAALLKSATGPADLSAVGDWVVIGVAADLDVPLIEGLLPRASAIVRGDPGNPSQIQVLAANVDTVFVVHPIDGPPNVRRIERELSLAWDSGAVPVVVLTKADAAEDIAAARDAVEAVAFGVDVLVTSALTGVAVDSLLSYVADHRTAVLIGPSGAGKSTLINALLGEDRQKTLAVRVSDRRGRHATVARELVAMPGGGLLIDTPGLRALGLTGSEAGISTTFAEIEKAAQRCRFRDCSHTGEPGCAVVAAVESGAIKADRLASYHKLLREAEVAAMKTNPRLRAEEVRKWKTIHKAAKDYYKLTGKPKERG